MKDETQLVRLLDALKETLPGLPGFLSLSLFGSLAEGRSDGYSDIDLVVETDDLIGAKTALLGLLEQIGPIEFCWAMSFRPDEWNPTIVFREEGYHHKLDLGLTDVSAADRTIPTEQTTLLIDVPRSDICGVRECRGYVPQEGSLGHFMLDKYIGFLRYVKARKRGQTMTCYRFAAGGVDWQLALMYARMTGDAARRPKLSTPEYVKLDGLLSSDDRATLLPSLDFSSLTAMDSTVRAAMDRMLQDARQLAAISGEELQTDVFERMSRFVSQELPPNTPDGRRQG